MCAEIMSKYLRTILNQRTFLYINLMFPFHNHDKIMTCLYGKHPYLYLSHFFIVSFSKFEFSLYNTGEISSFS